jgi:putative ABC transport system permease protein
LANGSNGPSQTYTVIGVIKDLVTDSPFEPVKQTAFRLNYEWTNFITIRLNPQMSAREALDIRSNRCFGKYNPGSPFDYKFASDEHDQKFRAEERIGKLATRVRHPGHFHQLPGFVRA